MTDENHNEKKETHNEEKSPENHNSDNHHNNHSNHNHHNHKKHNHSNNDNHEKHSDKKSSNKNTILKKVGKELSGNYWAISTIVLAVVLLLFVLSPSTSTTGNAIGEQKAGEIVLSFAEAQGLEAALVGVEYENGLYEVIVTIQDQDVPVYLTSDGENLVPSVIPIAEVLAQAQDQPPAQQQQQTPPPSSAPKSDKPTVELFIMTHCPYGTQAEKGFIPVMKILKDVADVKIRFVHYFLHKNPGQEPDETPIQVCLREEQPDLFLPYLEEFLAEGDSESSRAAVGVDEAALQECISSGRADEYYAEDSALSESYGVRGSPSLIINGAQSQAGRSEAAYLEGICGAFNTAPEDCDLTLDATNPAPGFGYGGSSAAAAAACS
jgi:protein-disulfide isomerase